MKTYPAITVAFAAEAESSRTSKPQEAAGESAATLLAQAAFIDVAARAPAGHESRQPATASFDTQ